LTKLDEGKRQNQCFRLLSGANAFPGVNSSHPMMSFQGRFLLGGWRAAALQ
jgi:hypothetical protein